MATPTPAKTVRFTSSTNPACGMAAVKNQLMGIDALGEVLENMKLLLLARHGAARGTPLVVPIFTKCQQNLAEMEQWYDQWTRALGSAVIRSPSGCAGQIPDHSLVDRSPTKRKPCARLSSRLTILSDGRVVSCEEDVLGTNVLGDLTQGDSIVDVSLDDATAELKTVPPEWYETASAFFG